MNKIKSFLYKPYNTLIRIYAKAVSVGLDSHVKNISRELQRRALISSVDFIENNMKNVRSFSNKIKLLNYALENVNIDNGIFLEFGVYSGESINHIAKKKEQNYLWI